MSAATRPRRRLPRRVYWFRRLLVLSVVLGLVAGVVALAGRLAGGDGEGTEAATPTSGQAAPAAEPEGAADQEKRRDRKKDRDRERGAGADRLPQPTGPCADADVRITPNVVRAYTNQPVLVDLEVTTAESPACTWRVDADSVFLTITSEQTVLWSSQLCPAAIPTVEVTPRRTEADTVRVRWEGQESDATCSDAGPWVDAGAYTATAVARGSDTPIDVGFVLSPGSPPAPQPAPRASSSPTESGGRDR
jgi:hypothetical protein